jgi:hypothetical protein
VWFSIQTQITCFTAPAADVPVLPHGAAVADDEAALGAAELDRVAGASALQLDARTLAMAKNAHRPR